MSAVETYHKRFCKTCIKSNICSKQGLELVVCALSKLNENKKEVFA